MCLICLVIGSLSSKRFLCIVLADWHCSDIHFDLFFFSTFLFLMVLWISNFHLSILFMLQFFWVMFLNLNLNFVIREYSVLLSVSSSQTPLESCSVILVNVLSGTVIDPCSPYSPWSKCYAGVSICTFPLPCVFSRLAIFLLCE